MSSDGIPVEQGQATPTLITTPAVSVPDLVPLYWIQNRWFVRPAKSLAESQDLKSISHYQLLSLNYYIKPMLFHQFSHSPGSLYVKPVDVERAKLYRGGWGLHDLRLLVLS